MKKLLLILAVALSASCYSQPDLAGMYNVNAPSTSSSDQSFVATLPGGENLVASHIIVESVDYVNIRRIHLDGSVTTIRNIQVNKPVRGLTCSASGNFTVLLSEAQDFYLLKFDASGNILWQKSITIGEPVTMYFPHRLNETPAGDYYLTISSYSYCGLVKIDANGNLLWNKRLTGPRDTGKCPGFCSAITQSGGCITSLKDENYETLINMDGSGNLVWSRSFGDASYRWTKAIRADQLGNFYIMGTFGSMSTDITFFQKVDANGNIVFAKKLSVATAFEDAYVDAADEFYILSQYPGLNMCKIGATGNIAWHEGIPSASGSAPSYYVNHLYFTSTPFLNKPVLLSSANDSTELVFRFVSPAANCHGTTAVVPGVSDDIQLLDASIDSTCNIGPLAVTITNSGLGTTTTEYFLSQDFCAAAASVNETNAATELMVFPNPASDDFTIQLGNIKLSQNAVVVIYDMTGRKVYQAAVNSMFFTVNTSGFATGLYSVIVSDQDNILGKQRVVVKR